MDSLPDRRCSYLPLRRDYASEVGSGDAHGSEALAAKQRTEGVAFVHAHEDEAACGIEPAHRLHLRLPRRGRSRVKEGVFGSILGP